MFLVCTERISSLNMFFQDVIKVIYDWNICITMLVFLNLKDIVVDKTFSRTNHAFSGIISCCNFIGLVIVVKT